jgi:uncharacterized SAM-binding protein YcdF (DUF218 family)
MEGIRIWKGLPNARLVLSGGSSPFRTSSDNGVAALPKEMGVPPGALVIVTSAWDTEDEARALKSIVGTQPFALVTSASHMRRAMALFRGLGMDPMACPCQYLEKHRPSPPEWFVPSASSLNHSTIAVHEHVGLLWYRLLGHTR